jgi:outer membrane receptor protein involved in Fe transport
MDAWLTAWLHAIAGLRYDQFFFDVSSSDPRNSGAAVAGRASPKVSAIFGPRLQTELFANFGYGFHSNDARGVTTRFDPGTGQPVEPVTPLVRTRGGEFGVRTEAIPRVQTSLALWRLDLDSELLFTGDAGTTEPSRPSRRQGLEWSTRWEPLRWLLFDLDVAWSWARFTAPDPDPAVHGDYIPGAIETAVSAGATIRDLGPWSGSVFLRYFGPRPLIEDNSVRSSSSTIVNAQVGYRIAKWAKVTLDVFNVFDARVDDIAYYYTSRLPGEPASGVNDIHFHPAEPRSFRGTVAVEF